MQRWVAAWLGFCLGCGSASQVPKLRPDELPPDLRSEATEVAAAHAADPNDASILYQVAAILARAGRSGDAMAALRCMASFETGVDPRPRDGFDRLAGQPEFERLVASIRASNPPVRHAREAFRIDEADLVPE